MAPLALSDDQLRQIFATASGLPQDQRGCFLQALAGLLTPAPGDGELYRACAAAAKAVRYNAMRCEVA
jgi:hypothetical protein